MITQTIKCNEAKRIDIVTYLESLQIKPIKVAGDAYWYLSPLRKEKTPSFKINRKLNAWFDHGLGKGGNLIDLGILLYNCTVAQFLERLNSQGYQNTFSFHQQSAKTAELAENEKAKISIKAIQELQSTELKNYIASRCISFERAKAFLKEIVLSINENEYIALGLKNNSGGFELRGMKEFKSSISPKDYTSFDTGKRALAVVEGMFDFLSHAETDKKIVPEPTDWLVLNSLSFLEKAIPFMNNYERVYLLLDNDPAGRAGTKRLLSLSHKFLDLSHHYQYSKDLNEWLMKEKESEQNHVYRSGRRM
jgi:DNA primase